MFDISSIFNLGKKAAAVFRFLVVLFSIVCLFLSRNYDSDAILIATTMGIFTASLCLLEIVSNVLIFIIRRDFTLRTSTIYGISALGTGIYGLVSGYGMWSAILLSSGSLILIINIFLLAMKFVEVKLLPTMTGNGESDY